MTRAEMYAKLVAYAGDDYESSQDDFLYFLIDAATEEVRSIMYPSAVTDEDTLATQTEAAMARYPYKIQRIAEYHYDKVGKEGVKSFTENSTSSSYEVAGTPPSMLTHIIPVSQVV